MFIGEYRHAVDEKGRLSIPVKFRAELAEGAVVTRGLDNSLFLFTKKEWERLAEKLSALPMGQADTRAFTRLMLAGAMDVAIDSQGRVVLPEYLRLYAGVAKNVVVAGLFTRMEIWDAERWDAYKQATEADADRLAEQMGNLGV